MTQVTKVRLVVLIPAVLLAAFIVSFFERVWSEFWLSRHVLQTSALITGERAHGVVDYKYSVAGQDYTGRSQRNWTDERHRHVHVGEKCVAYYSPSHPWLSSLQVPVFPPSSTPVLFFVLGLECFLILTIVKPTSRWALKIRT